MISIKEITTGQYKVRDTEAETVVTYRTLTDSKTPDLQTLIDANSVLGTPAPSPSIIPTELDGKADVTPTTDSANGVVQEYKSTVEGSDRSMLIKGPSTGNGNDPFTFDTGNSFNFVIDGTEVLGINADQTLSLLGTRFNPDDKLSEAQSANDFYFKSEIDIQSNEVKATCLNTFGKTKRFSLNDVSQTTDIWHLVAQVNLGSGGINLRGSIGNHVQTNGTQMFDITVQGRAGNTKTDVTVSGTVIIDHEGSASRGVGVKVTKFSDPTDDYHVHNIYIRTTNYSQAEIDITEIGTASYYFSSPAQKTTEPVDLDVVFDSSFLKTGSYNILNTEVRELGLNEDYFKFESVNGQAVVKFNSSTIVEQKTAAFVTSATWSAEGVGSNIDHIWHDDTGNVWHFCSDSDYKAGGNSTLKAGQYLFTDGTSVGDLMDTKLADIVLSGGGIPSTYLVNANNNSTFTTGELVSGAGFTARFDYLVNQGFDNVVTIGDVVSDGNVVSDGSSNVFGVESTFGTNAYGTITCHSQLGLNGPLAMKDLAGGSTTLNIMNLNGVLQVNGSTYVKTTELEALVDAILTNHSLI